MQLKKTPNISHALALATSTLLTGAVSTAQAEEQPWDIDSSLLIYSEDDSRVQDISLKSAAKKALNSDETVTIKASIDALTGASPNGAISSNRPQTFTSPSGKKSYTTAAGEIPLDDTFHDTRLSLSGSWDKRWNARDTTNMGGSLSKEFDYLHLGVNGIASREFNNRNTTLSSGISLSLDTIEPVGGVPNAGAEVLPFDDPQQDRGASSDDKTIVDLLFGVTQVINRRTIAQLNYSYSQANGYLNDPYKILSIVDPITGNPVDGSGDQAGFNKYRFDNRPDSRTGHNLYAKVKHHLAGDTVDLSYRYHTDDWGIDSHTVDLRYRFNLDEKHYIEPHARYYTQTAADFHRYFLVEGDAPQYASSDYRLAEFDATTLGIKYGYRISEQQKFSIRLERYEQKGDSSPSVAFGNLTQQDLYPDTAATILQANYRFQW